MPHSLGRIPGEHIQRQHRPWGQTPPSYMIPRLACQYWRGSCPISYI